MNEGEYISYEIYESIFMEELNKQAPMKDKYVRANNAPFMNKILSKAFMNRTRLRNKFLKNPNATNKENYTKYRNYCVNLVRREKKKYYENLDQKSLLDNKTFWKVTKPLFSEKSKSNKKIVLLENDNIISDEPKVAEIFNEFFAKTVENLNIKGYNIDHTPVENLDFVNNAIDKFENHPSILMIKENVQVNVKFSFSTVKEYDFATEIIKLDTRKPTSFNNIPAKILKMNQDLCAPPLCVIFNQAVCDGTYPDTLKKADLTPCHKQDETTNKSNYRPISILPTVSKVFERILDQQMYSYMNKHFSSYLCGFRKGYSTQYSLIGMLEKWKRALDKSGIAGALLTDLSKAFDCLNHELLIAKMEAYGFDRKSLLLIASYLSNRKHRTKVNNSFSTWRDILSGIPQGSNLGPDLFNIYINDIFYFVNEDFLTNFADDNTPYAIGKNIRDISSKLEDDARNLLNWFEINFFKMNADKCKLLITKHDNEVSINVDGHIIQAKKSVKLLGITIDNNLDFNEHVSKLCKKVSLKIYALARVAHFMNKDKLRILMKAFIESQFAYCPLIWMFHSRELNNKINKLHERALRLVYNDHMSTFDELLLKDESLTVHHRNLQKLAIEMYKIRHNLSPQFMNSIFPSSDCPYKMRIAKDFEVHNIKTVYKGSETISYRGPLIWKLVPNDIKISKSLNEFKAKIKKWKPDKCNCRICKIYIKDLGFIN